MNNNTILIKRKLNSNYQKYKILVIIMTIAFILGILFFYLISKNNKIIVINSIKNFFKEVATTNNLNYTSSLINSLLVNTFYIAIIWLLGISIIGIPIILIIMSYKAFITGFSICSIINVYHIKGILLAIAYIFPHNFIFILILILLGFHSINFSIKLFKYLFLKKIINFKDIMKKYIKILFICLIISLILSLFETFISTYLIKVSLLLLKIT